MHSSRVRTVECTREEDQVFAVSKAAKKGNNSGSTPVRISMATTPAPSLFFSLRPPYPGKSLQKKSAREHQRGQTAIQNSFPSGSAITFQEKPSISWLARKRPPPSSILHCVAVKSSTGSQDGSCYGLRRGARHLLEGKRNPALLLCFKPDKKSSRYLLRDSHTKYLCPKS